MEQTNNEKKLVVTRKELKAMLMNRLNTLQYDLIKSPEEANRCLSDLKETRNDKIKALMDDYAKDNAPVKVSDISGIPKRECDMTGEMIDFCEGFDRYIDSIEKEYASIKKRRKEAVKLMTMLMSIKQPYAKILYLRYYRKMSPEVACKEMHIARSTMFRRQSNALNLLSDLFAENYDIIIKPDDKPEENNTADESEK